MGRATENKLVAWRERLRRYAESDLTVVAFCTQEGVSTPSFYAWRRRVKTQESAVERTPRGKAPAFQAVTVVGTMPVLSVHLPGGTQVDVCVPDPEVIRAVVAELVRASQGTPARPAGGAAC